MKNQHLVLLLFIPALAQICIAQKNVANFGLKDQNDKFVEVNFPSDRPVVFIFGDRKGSSQIDGWSQPIYKRYEGKVYVFGVASLSGVPNYARGLVRRLIKRQTSFPVLLDWGGKVAGSLGYEKNKAMVLIVGNNGTVIVRKHGAASKSELDQIYSELDKRIN